MGLPCDSTMPERCAHAAPLCFRRPSRYCHEVPLLKGRLGISRDVTKCGFIGVSRSASSGLGISITPSCSSLLIWKVRASSDVAAFGALAAQAECQPIRRTASRNHRPFSTQERGMRRTHLKSMMLEIGRGESWGRPAGVGSFKVCCVQPAMRRWALPVAAALRKCGQTSENGLFGIHSCFLAPFESTKLFT